MVKHIVMWTLKDEAEGGTKAQNALKLKAMIEGLQAVIPEILRIEVGINFNPSGDDVVLYSEFASRAALETYQQHPEHVKVAEFVGKVKAERHVVDYEMACRYCPQCRSEYVEGITECAECHVPLVDSLPDEEIPEYESFQVVRIYTTRYDAELGRSILEANAIEAVIAADDAGGGILGAGLAFVQGVQLLVHAEDLERAREVFQDLESAPPVEESEEMPE
jgi:hypothetical protein